MTDATASTRAFLVRAHGLSARAHAHAGLFRFAFAAVAAVLALFVLDALFPLPAWLRGICTCGGIVVTYVRLRQGLRPAVSAPRASADELLLERAAVEVEARHPELESALINAVQFGSALAEEEGHTAQLMRTEVARAGHEAERLPAEEEGDRAQVRAARTRFVSMSVAAVIALAAYPRLPRYELPRFLAFWQDRPPFTLTDFRVEPRGARVRPGGSVEVVVTVGGLKPETMSLVTQSRGERERPTPLAVLDDGRYSLLLEDLRRDTSYYVRANTGRSERYVITVDQAPQVKSVLLKLTPPQYTGRGAAFSQLGKQGIEGLAGTRVDLDIEGNRPLEGGRLVVSAPNAPDEAVVLKPVDAKPGHVGASTVIRRDGTFRLDLTATDGLATKGAASGPVKLLHDENPQVAIAEPGGNGVATPEMSLNVRVEAQDDVGLQRVEVRRIVNGLGETASTFPIPPGHREAAVSVPIDLKDLGVRPGDVIEYYGSAFDNDPGKPHVADSDRNWIWVVSKEDFKRITRQQRGIPQMAQDYRSMTQSLRELAERQKALADKMDALRKSPPGGPGSRQAVKAARDLRQAQADLEKEAAALARAMKDLAKEQPQYDLEKGLQKKLGELARGVDPGATKPMSEAAQGKSPSQMASASAEAARKMEALSGEAQRSVDAALDAVEKGAPLYADVERLKQITKAQGELAMQASETARQKGSDSFKQARLGQHQRAQEDLKRQLHEVRNALEADAQQAQEVSPEAATKGRELADALDKLGAAEKMGQAADAYGKSAASRGASLSEQARRLLESLMSKGGT